MDAVLTVKYVTGEAGSADVAWRGYIDIKFNATVTSFPLRVHTSKTI